MFLRCRHSVPTVTGLIYVVIIGLWAAVLIPIWIKRHDQISEVRSTARFSSAMKSLGGRGQMQFATDGYDLDEAYAPVTPMHTQDRGSSRGRDHTEARMVRGSENPQREGMDPDYERELVRQAAATRRAMVLASLTGLLLLVLVLAIAGVAPQWAPILAALPVVAFVLATALTASTRSAAPATSRRSAAPRRSAVDRPVAQPMPAAVEDDWENWNAWDDDDESWDAVPTTLPTYVSAPRASAVPREIDRSHPGEWTGEAMVETARAMRSRPVSSPLANAGEIDYSAETTEIPVVDDAYAGRRAANQ